MALQPLDSSLLQFLAGLVVVNCGHDLLPQLLEHIQVHRSVLADVVEYEVPIRLHSLHEVLVLHAGGLFVRIEEGQRHSEIVLAACPPDSVLVGLKVEPALAEAAGHLIVQDQPHCADVYAARHHITWKQNLEFALAKTLQHLFAAGHI